MAKEVKTLNPMQEKLYLSASPNIAILGGFGGGKSWGALYKVRELMRTQPKSLWMIGRSTLKDLRADTFEICFGNAGLFNGLGKFNKVDKEFHMYNGSKAFFAHFDDPNTLKGPSLSGILIEQAEGLKEESFKVLTSRLRQWGRITTKGTAGYRYIQENAGRTDVIKVPKHYFFVVANPGGHSWIKERFLDKKQDIWEIIHSTTYDNEVNLPENYISDLKKQHNDLWIRQYIDGSFEKAEGIVYPEFTDAHIIDPIKPKANEKIYVGLDPGYGHASASVFAVIREGVLIVYDEVYEKQKTISEICTEIRKTNIKHFSAIQLKNIDFTYLIDPSSAKKDMGTGISQKQYYVENGIEPIPADNESKAARHVIKDLLKAKKILVTSNCLNTIREFGTFKWHPKDPDKVIKMDDDCLDALKYIINYQPEWKKSDVGIGEDIQRMEDRKVATDAYIAHIFAEEFKEKEDESSWGLRIF